VDELEEILKRRVWELAQWLEALSVKFGSPMRGRKGLAKVLTSAVGAPRFELGTSSPPD
jgi:hypothetical protein